MKTTTPRVSVIIPVYNRREFITEAMESVLAQTYKDYEIIVVDDGSAVDIKEAINPYLHKIKYVYQENKGLAAARNTGIRASTGKYVAFLDDDDLFEPGKLENQVKILETNPELGFVYSDYYFFNTKSKSKKLLYQTRLRNIPKHEFTQYYYIHHDLAVSSFLAQRIGIEQTGMFDESLEVVEDVDFWSRLSLLYPGRYSNYPSTSIRLDSERMSQDRVVINKNLIIVLERLLVEYRDFARTIGVSAKKKLVKVHFKLGKAFFNKGEISQAREEFLFCFKSYPLLILRVYVYLFFCVIGNRTAGLFLKPWRFMWNLFIKRLAFWKKDTLTELSR